MYKIQCLQAIFLTGIERKNRRRRATSNSSLSFFYFEQITVLFYIVEAMICMLPCNSTFPKPFGSMK